MRQGPWCLRLVVLSHWPSAWLLTGRNSHLLHKQMETAHLSQREESKMAIQSNPFLPRDPSCYLRWPKASGEVSVFTDFRM
jgi:hypothetical protein